MAKKIKQPDGTLLVRKSYWSAISIWWGIIVFLIAIPTVLIGYIALDFDPYMKDLTTYKPLLEYAQKLEVEPTLELYFEALGAGAFKPYKGGFMNLNLTGMLIDLGLTLPLLNLLKIVLIVVAIAVFIASVVCLIVKGVCTKKTFWKFYDGAVIYSQGRVFYSESTPRDIDFFPGMQVSLKRTIKGKIFGYGDIVLSNGAGEAGDVVMHGVKKPKEVQRLLNELLALCCTRTANMMSPYKMYPQMYRNVLGGYPAYYYGNMQIQNMQQGKK